jgi:hypothetical protein
MKLFKTVLFFAFVLFCFVSFARAQAALITNGTFNITGGFPPNSTAINWIIGGEGFFSTIAATEVQVMQPIVRRAGAPVEAFALTYIPQASARGNVVNNTAQWIGIYYGSENNAQRTTFNFNFPAHALPKFTPNRNDVFIDLPFTMNAQVAGFSSPQSPTLLFSRQVTGSGVAHLNYIRVPDNFRSRKAPNPDVWLAYILFDFNEPAAATDE